MGPHTLSWCQRALKHVSKVESQTVPTPQTTVPAPDFQSLVGQWIRIDSYYVIDIESVSQDGTLQAKYYNTRPFGL
jgi:hypothetical protein